MNNRPPKHMNQKLMEMKGKQLNNNSLIRLTISLIIRLPYLTFNNGENK